MEPRPSLSWPKRPLAISINVSSPRFSPYLAFKSALRGSFLLALAFSSCSLIRSRALPSRSPSPSESLNFFFSPENLSFSEPNLSLILSLRDFLGLGAGCSASGSLGWSTFSSFLSDSGVSSVAPLPGKNLPLINPNALPSIAPALALFSLKAAEAFSLPSFIWALPASIRFSASAFFSFAFSAAASFFFFSSSAKASFFKAASSLSFRYLSLKISPSERVLSSPIDSLASSTFPASFALTSKAFCFSLPNKPGLSSSPSFLEKKPLILSSSFLLSSLTLSIEGSLTTGLSSLTIPRLILIFWPSSLRKRILRTWMIVFRVRLPINCIAGTGSLISLIPLSFSPASPIMPEARSLTRPKPALTLSNALKAWRAKNWPAALESDLNSSLIFFPYLSYRLSIIEPSSTTFPALSTTVPVISDIFSMTLPVSLLIYIPASINLAFMIGTSTPGI